MLTQVEAFLKFVHYPPHLRPTQSALFTPGNENSWHKLLGVLDWLVCYLEYRDKVAQSPTGWRMGALSCRPLQPTKQAQRCSDCLHLMLNWLEDASFGNKFKQLIENFDRFGKKATMGQEREVQDR